MGSLCLLAGCQEPTIQVYEAPKDPPRAVAMSRPAMPAATPAAAPTPASSGLRWTLPEGWHETAATGAQTAAFHAHGGGEEADVIVVEFPNATDETEFYAHLMQLVAKTEVTESGFVDTPVGPHTARIAAISGSGEEALVAALLPLGGRLWYSQISGTPAQLAGVRPSFEAFLGSLTLTEPPAPPAAGPVMAGTTPPGSAMMGQSLPAGALARGATPTWTTPPHWGAGPASSMRRGSYRVEGGDGAVLDIAVTAFPGDVGGLLPNLNRWRQQIGLGPLSPAELPTATSTLTVGSETATWVDFTGLGDRPQRTLVGYFQVAGETWFFKATGNAALAAQEEGAFRAFVESVRFPSR